ncbi:MAG TPA: hypothetical protein VN361_10160 [Oxalicibacterium sp.]|nr:hypothetical protein [Oxalicibacterium sp.]
MNGLADERAEASPGSGQAVHLRNIGSSRRSPGVQIMPSVVEQNHNRSIADFVGNDAGISAQSFIAFHHVPRFTPDCHTGLERDNTDLLALQQLF